MWAPSPNSKAEIAYLINNTGLNIGIDTSTKQLDKLIDSIVEWRQTRDLLLSAKGVGKVLAYTLMSELPELGSFNRKEIAALVACMRKQLTILNIMVKNNTY